MIEKILPPQVAVVEALSDPVDAALFPGEEELIRNSVESRRKEFTTARWCARRALGMLGFAPVPILKGERGAPIWPEGVVGSMTHCAGYRAAAVARRADLLSVGIDAEPHEPLPDGVHETIALPAEKQRERELRRTAPEIRWDRLLFSAKESVYKVWFPLTHRWLGFEQADIVLHSNGTFTADLLIPATDPDPAPPGGATSTPTGFRGRWLVADGLVATAIAVESEPDTPTR
ncbi:MULTISPECIES: 4'-phosphopantetheinyl transferase family protein [unclassified Streptomyces]|uniref:4'-phosphopantetheinyl transferase family protein n=1 Tax=unclassified Streptomyces TaxID=2593676 RepID=UPI002259F328|nr:MULTISPECIES: 4'-phosphopantetheinyl transferase superfamily protein [unclassified Streptomyces]WSP58217.1 4'-phosphopantetheinyl transferase superfamily protein [Streptomyces sp. NBC_01241]WSU21205.1 4'-phosphopantetheinyl transferase superfamily protein [Streptomyces sp. NBC_01108]MCX4789964.1 4'-phosphopantetheinyl transferase superfamily protein [Streptomyces sp. NBC_01221]MCX4794304.1 4'-phosphopantetheinyl transferase superfamily protein [Streptomyces sp. NBC_01242]WSP62122.1 4'-phosp